MNTLNGFRFLRNKFTSVGPGYAVMEMTQRNSRHGIWEGNTFEIVQGGFGEYAADIRFVNNTFRIHPNERTSVGLMIGGKDIVFRGNTMTCGSITGGQGWGCVLVDCAGPGYERYVGNITIADNKFTYQGDGNQCVHLVAHDTSFTAIPSSSRAPRWAFAARVRHHSRSRSRATRFRWGPGPVS
jgi:hypothetical protein